MQEIPPERDKIDRSKPPKNDLISKLPDEIKLFIASKLNKEEDVVSLSLTSRKWNQICEDESLLPMEHLKEAYPKLGKRVEEVVREKAFRLEWEQKPLKKRGMISKLFGKKEKKPEPKKVSIEPNTRAYRAAFVVVFMKELTRLCHDYEIEVDENVTIKLEIVKDIRKRIEQKQNVALCQFCRIVLPDRSISREKNLDDPGQAQKEAEEWRENLEDLPPNIQEINIENPRKDIPQFHYIPPEIQYFSSLKSLRTTYMDIKSIPLEISNLINLKAIHFHRCDLHSLPPEIGKLSELETILILNGTDLLTGPTAISIPKELLQCEKLKECSIGPVNEKDKSTDIILKLIRRGVTFNILA